MRSGWKISRPRSNARRLISDWSRLSPRPAARSGWVTTRATSCPASLSWFNVGKPNPAVPANTMRNRASGADEFFFLLLILRFDLAQRVEAGQTVGEENAVNVVDLVLDGARQQRITLELHRLAVPVEPPCHHLHVTLDLTHISGAEQAAFDTDLLAIPLDHLRVHQGMQVGVRLDHHDAQPHPDLRRGQTHPRSGHHGIDHVVD